MQQWACSALRQEATHTPIGTQYKRRSLCLTAKHNTYSSDTQGNSIKALPFEWTIKLLSVKIWYLFLLQRSVLLIVAGNTEHLLLRYLVYPHISPRLSMSWAQKNTHLSHRTQIFFHSPLNIPTHRVLFFKPLWKLSAFCFLIIKISVWTFYAWKITNGNPCTKKNPNKKRNKWWVWWVGRGHSLWGERRERRRGRRGAAAEHSGR